MTEETEKFAYLDEELRVAVELLKAGLRSLQAIDGANDFYHLPLLTLANGLERFTKVIICFYAHEAEGVFPSRPPWNMGRDGHDLEKLLDRVIDECFSSDYIRKIPVGKSDAAFLRQDGRLRKIVKILSDFGKSARYHNLDMATVGKSDTGSPDVEWGNLEIEVLKDDPDWAENLEAHNGLDYTFAGINNRLVIIIEVLARALSRLFTIGGLGAKAKQASSVVYPFLMIQDCELRRCHVHHCTIVALLTMVQW